MTRHVAERFLQYPVDLDGNRIVERHRLAVAGVGGDVALGHGEHPDGGATVVVTGAQPTAARHRGGDQSFGPGGERSPFGHSDPQDHGDQIVRGQIG